MMIKQKKGAHRDVGAHVPNLWAMIFNCKMGSRRTHTSTRFHVCQSLKEMFNTQARGRRYIASHTWREKGPFLAKAEKNLAPRYKLDPFPSLKPIFFFFPFPSPPPWLTPVLSTKPWFCSLLVLRVWLCVLSTTSRQDTRAIPTFHTSIHSPLSHTSLRLRTPASPVSAVQPPSPGKAQKFKVRWVGWLRESKMENGTQHIRDCPPPQSWPGS